MEWQEKRKVDTTGLLLCFSAIERTKFGVDTSRNDGVHSEVIGGAAGEVVTGGAGGGSGGLPDCGGAPCRPA